MEPSKAGIICRNGTGRQKQTNSVWGSETRDILEQIRYVCFTIELVIRCREDRLKRRVRLRRLCQSQSVVCRVLQRISPPRHHSTRSPPSARLLQHESSSTCPF